MKPHALRDALARLAAAEAHFLGREFLAPVVRRGEVNVRLAGVVCRFEVKPPGFEGWGVFRPESLVVAGLVRPATLAERRDYLRLLPPAALILCGREGRRWYGLAAREAGPRVRVEGPAPVDFVEEGRAFDTVIGRFDGGRFLYERPDLARDPGAPAYLRARLDRLAPPESLDRPGLTGPERDAYDRLYQARLRDAEQFRRGHDELRLRRALRHAGARLVDFVDRDDSFRVTFEVDGRRHVSAVSRRDLTVQVAGICLSGQDRRFDLQSLVGVIRLGIEGGEVLPIGEDNGGMPEPLYFDIHPEEG